MTDNGWKEGQVPLSKTMLSILNSEKGKVYLDRQCAFEEEETRITIQDRCLKIATRNCAHLSSVQEKFSGLLDYNTVLRSDISLPHDKLIKLQSKLETDLLIKVSWSDCRKAICVSGIREDVLSARKYIQTLIEQCKTKVVHIKGPQAELFKRFFCQDITAVLIKAGVYFVISNDEFEMIEVRFRGNQDQMDDALQRLKDLDARVKSHEWSLESEFQAPEDRDLINASLTPTSLDEIFQGLELKKKFIISTDYPVTYPQCLIFSLTNTCQLLIKSGKRSIVTEVADVLVCVLSESKKRLTRVGWAFKRACPSFKELLKKEKKRSPTDNVHMIEGPFQSYLQCKAIICVTLRPWNENTSIKELREAVAQVIDKAASLKAKSISFPPLGYGELLQFPPSEMAWAMFEGLKKGRFDNSLQRIVILALEQEIVDGFKRQISGLFQTLPIQTSVTVVPDDPTASVSPDEEGNSQHNSIYSLDNVDQVRPLEQSRCAGLQMFIVSIDENTMNYLRSEIKKLITENYLCTEVFSQEIFDSWSPESMQKISDEAKKLSVKATLLSDKAKPGYEIKGEKEAVANMMEFIKEEFHKLSACVPEKRIISSATPARDTSEFIQHAANCNELYPSYWKLRWSFRNAVKGAISMPLIPDGMMRTIDMRTKTAIIDLVQQTFDGWLVGRSRNGTGLNHKSVKVVEVKGFHNLALFREYGTLRKRLFQKMTREKSICQALEQLPSSTGGVATTALLPEFMREELYHEINEHYLFYGTPSETVDDVLMKGPSLKIPDHFPNCGKGIYFAETSVQADQYTDHQHCRTPKGTTLTLILARVLLGNVYLYNQDSAVTSYTPEVSRPPCMRCQKDRCNCPDQVFFDSVVEDGSSLFREFVVYDSNYCYPEYVIKYRRV